MIKSKYNPENGIVSLWNCLNTQQRYDYTLLDLDTNLCFTKGWIDFPPKGYGELLVWEGIRPYINSLGVKVQLLINGEVKHFQDHYTSDNFPQNYFFNNPH